MANLGMFLGGVVDQRNNVVQQGFQDRALALQENQMRASERTAQIQSIRENMNTIADGISEVAANGGQYQESLNAADQTIQESIAALAANGRASEARSLAAEWQARRQAIMSTPTPEEAARMSGELSATASVANRNALVEAGAPDPWAAATETLSSDMFDQRGRLNPSTQRLVQSQVGQLYGATFDANGNFVLPGDENQLQEAISVQAETVRLLEAMPDTLSPAEAVIIAQRNVRARARGAVDITGGTQPLGDTPETPLPIPSSAAEAQAGKYYRLRDGRIGRWNGEAFEVQ